MVRALMSPAPVHAPQPSSTPAPYHPLDRHPLIFSTFDSLHPGQAFELINNHDPVPLYFRFRKVRHRPV
jgi:uncharacterized protein (DUF2249 family)